LWCKRRSRASIAMKILKKEFENDGKGSVTLRAEESEDLWHLYNLVAQGDEVKALTYRKVQSLDGKGNETKKLRLTIEVKNVEYDAKGENIRFSGQICEENDWVKMGAHHTIEVELREAFTIIKSCWDEVFVQQLEDATDIAKAAEVAVVLIEAKDMGNANFSLLTNVLAKRVGSVSQVLPRKRLTSTQIDKAMEKFFQQMYDLVKLKIDLAIVKCVVLGGPGSTKTEFNQWCQTHAMQVGDSDIVKNKAVFVCVDTTDINNKGLEQVLGCDQVQKRIANTKAALHFKSLEEFQTRLTNRPEMACYGPKEVKKAFDMGAIHTLMISDGLFRNSSIQLRKDYVKFVAEVKDSGSTVHIFSSGHVTGIKLKDFADIAANLRFQVEYEEHEHDEEHKVDASVVVAEETEAPAPERPRLDRAMSTVSTVSMAPEKKAALIVEQVQLALGGTVSTARVEQALSSAKGCAEDAYLVLLGQELDGSGKEPEPEKEEANVFQAGDVVEVVYAEFKSNNKGSPAIPMGQIGSVIKIDSAGDAYIDFGEGFAKHWVKPRSWCHLALSQASFAPPPREAAKAPAKTTAAASKPVAKAAGKAAVKPKAKPKKQAAAMQWDDYDYY